jgi:potassium uptake TrkH family protein
VTLTARGFRNTLLPRNPAQAVVVGFVVAIVVGTALLMLPAARVGDGGAPFADALFTATSAISVTGLTVVDTATYWSEFGQMLIAVEVHVGGFGIVTSAALLVMVVGRRMGLRASLLAQSESNALNLGDVRRVVMGVAVVSLVVETVATLVLAARFFFFYDYSAARALGYGAFHAITAFNNAGFALYSDNLMGFASDAWILLPIALTIILGSLGLPVFLDLRGRLRSPRRWSLHTKLVLTTTAALLILGTVGMCFAEWNNAATMQGQSARGKVLLGFFNGVTPRTAGFNAVDYGQVEPETLFLSDILMFIGGASGSTAGGIKVTALALLTLMVIAEMRGRTEVTAFRRRIPAAAQRQALAVALSAIVLVTVSTLLFMALTPYGLDTSLFEVVSAFATVGLSTGITADLPASAEAILTVLMFIGRVGPLTLGIALVMREGRALYRHPEERPIIG